MNAKERMSLLQDYSGCADLQTKIVVLSYILSDCGFEYAALLKQCQVEHETVQRWCREYVQCVRDAYTEKGSEKPDNILATVMARKGSTGLPSKALRDLNGTKVIGHTLETCRNSKFVNKFVVTTDGHEIAEYARGGGAHIIMRPEEFGINFMELSIVMNHALINLAVFDDYYPDITINLFPTHPFRTAEQLDSAILELIQNKYFAHISREHVPQVKGRQIYFRVNDSLQHFHCLSYSKKYYCQRGFINAFNNRECTGEYHYADIDGVATIDIDTYDDIAFAKDCCEMVSIERFQAPCTKPVTKVESDEYDDFVACISVDSDRVFYGKHPAQDLLEKLNSMGFKHIVLCGKQRSVIDGLADIYRGTHVFYNLINMYGWPTRTRFTKLLQTIQFEALTTHRFLNIVVLDSTFPYISEEIIANNILKYKENNCRPTVSTSKMSSDCHLYKLATMQSGMLKPVHPNYIGFRQLYPDLYIEDGLVNCVRYADLTGKRPFPILPGNACEQALLTSKADDEFTYRKILAKCGKLKSCYVTLATGDSHGS